MSGADLRSRLPCSCCRAQLAGGLFLVLFPRYRSS